MLRDSSELGRARLTLARVVLATLTLAVAVWLGYAFGRGQSLAEVARLYRDQTVMDFTIDTGQLVAVYARTGGDLKPLLRTPDGAALVDYSDWDYNGAVIVDGQRYELVRLVPSANVDYARKRIVAGLSSGDWVLSREITLDGAEAELRFTFVANRPVREVWVSLPHVNWYYLEVELGENGFTARLPRATRSEIETGVIRSPAYEMTLTATPEGEPLPGFVRIGLSTPYGVYSVITQYLIREPPVGQYVPFATERVRWRPV